MSGHSFRSIFMVASCAGAALGCYLVSLRVASERAALENVESQIVMAQRDIRLLQTEIGTRGRLAQLERWNVKVLALSAPSVDQFLEGGFALAKLTRPQEMIDPAASVVLASAPAPDKSTPLAEPEQGEDSTPPAGPAQLMRHASLKVEMREESRKPAFLETAPKAAVEAAKPAEAKPFAAATTLGGKPKPAAPRPVAAARPPSVKQVASSKPSEARLVDRKSTEKKDSLVAKPVTKPTRLAKADPLAPLPDSRKAKTAKDSGTAQ